MSGSSVLGTTTIPAKPKRIISIDASGKLTDVILYLHENLVGTTTGPGGSWPSEIADVIPSTVQNIGQRPQWDFEKIAALHPDLITGLPSEFDQNYPKFTAIAPTVAIGYAPPKALDWEWYTEQVATVLGDSAKMPAIRTSMREAAVSLSNRLGGWDVAFVQAVPSTALIQIFQEKLFPYLARHDLNQAARYAHHIIALKDGRLAAQGALSQVVTTALLADVFTVTATIISDPVSGTPLCIPISVVTTPSTDDSAGVTLS